MMKVAFICILLALVGEILSICLLRHGKIARKLQVQMFHMDYVTLGNSDLKISKITLGTMTWGQQNTIEEASDQLDLAFKEYGINILDTAEVRKPNRQSFAVTELLNM